LGIVISVAMIIGPRFCHRDTETRRKPQNLNGTRIKSVKADNYGSNPLLISFRYAFRILLNPP
jgi:hypothetical protein